MNLPPFRKLILVLLLFSIGISTSASESGFFVGSGIIFSNLKTETALEKMPRGKDRFSRWLPIWSILKTNGWLWQFKNRIWGCVRSRQQNQDAFR